jgi:tetratricopeptide (TPR) repeat protein
MRLIFRVLGVACLLAWPASAQSPANAQSVEVKKFLNAAITLYENLEYEKALKQVGRARKKASSAEDEVKVNLLEGTVLADMGREQKALESFSAAFSLDPDARMPLEVSPKVMAVAQRARENVKKVLASTLEQQRADEEHKAAEAAAARQREEEALRLQAIPPPPPAPIVEATTPPPVPPKRSGVLKTWAILPAAAGVASGIGSAILFASAARKEQALSDGTAPPDQAATYRTRGKAEALVGAALGVTACVGLAAGATLWLLDKPAGGAAVAFAPMPGGGLWVGASWGLPEGKTP